MLDLQTDYKQLNNDQSLLFTLKADFAKPSLQAYRHDILKPKFQFEFDIYGIHTLQFIL
jgi:hypothetical protein